MLQKEQIQGRRKIKMTGGAKTGCKAANLGGSGGMPPLENLRFEAVLRCILGAFGTIVAAI